MKSIEFYSTFSWRALLGGGLFMLTFLQSWAQPADSLSIKIGQMILIGFPGTQPDSLVLNEIRAGKVGTIIFFEKNIPGYSLKGASTLKSPSFTSLKKIIWTYQSAATIPLLIAIDQEGGKVNRLKDKYGFPRSITAQDMGRAPSLDSVRFYAEATAATLAGLGINLNFAPVVDLGVNKENTVIYKVGRAYSANADTVALLAREFILQHRKYHVLTTLKHFPGHGSSLADTHYGVADVTNTWTTAELTPYEKLLSDGSVDAVMTAHIVNRKLDPKGYPGTLSKRILDSLLRKRLHFNGVVFSDDMQMFAIEKQYGIEESIRLSIDAGVDILCFSNNITGSQERTVDKVHSVIRGLVERGQIKMERIDEAYRRIMALKRRIGPVGGNVSITEPVSVSKEIRQAKDTSALKEPAPETKKKKKRKKSP